MFLERADKPRACSAVNLPNLLPYHIIHVNIILFRPPEVQLPLPRNDPRARHILTVLRRGAGDTFDAGLVNGPRGKGSVISVGPDHLELAFAWGEPPPPPDPLIMLIGLPRPQTARDILREATALGVAAMHFVRTEKGEASYADSTLWRTAEWEECVITGAAQAFCTRLPEVTHGRTLAEAVAALPADNTRIALDNYEASRPLPKVVPRSGQPVVLAVGAERGWSAEERAFFRQHGFSLAHLGPRVLRTETACIAALAVVKAQRGWL
jgi:16S rRNA (uracil1498-N3)-methyltransferase